MNSRSSSFLYNANQRKRRNQNSSLLLFEGRNSYGDIIIGFNDLIKIRIQKILLKEISISRNEIARMNPTTPIDVKMASHGEYMNARHPGIIEKQAGACMILWRALGHSAFGGIIILFCYYIFAFEDWRPSYSQMVCNNHCVAKPITSRICKNATLIADVFKNSKSKIIYF